MRLLVQNYHLAFFFLDRSDWCKCFEVEVKVDVIPDDLIPLWEGQTRSRAFPKDLV